MTRKYTLPPVVAATVGLGTCACLLYGLRSMTQPTDVESLAWLHIALGAVTFLSTTFFTAPYGRYSQDTFMPFEVNAQVAWMVQESPTLVNVGLTFYLAVKAQTEMGSVYHLPILFYTIHYVHRTLIFPLIIRPRNQMPLHVMLLATVYCTFNGYLQSIANLQSNAAMPVSYVPLFWIGAFLFVAGMSINILSDYALVRLRSTTKGADTKTDAKTHYKIPRHWLFRYVSCPNLSGEMLEWLGYGVSVLATSGVSCGLAGLSFSLYTISNLLPRARRHHQWYLETFGEAYQSLNRKAVVPFIL